MDTNVTVDTQQLKDSYKRNTVGKTMLALVVTGIVYIVYVQGFIMCFTAFLIVVAYLLLSEIFNYWMILSVLTDRALFAIRKRATR